MYPKRLFRGPSTNDMKSRMVLATPGPLLTPPPSSSPLKTPFRSYSAQIAPEKPVGKAWVDELLKDFEDKEAAAPVAALGSPSSLRFVALRRPRPCAPATPDDVSSSSYWSMMMMSHHHRCRRRTRTRATKGYPEYDDDVSSSSYSALWPRVSISKKYV